MATEKGGISVVTENIFSVVTEPIFLCVAQTEERGARKDKDYGGGVDVDEREGDEVEGVQEGVHEGEQDLQTARERPKEEPVDEEVQVEVVHLDDCGTGRR